MESNLIHYGVMCDHCKTSPIAGNRYKCPMCPNSDSCSNCLKKIGTCAKCSFDLCFAHKVKNLSGWAGGKCKRCAKAVDYVFARGKIPLLGMLENVKNVQKMRITASVQVKDC